MALGLASTVGFTGFRFVTALTGATAGVVYYVVSGPGRIGSAGLVIDVMPSGVTEVVIRGGGTDTQFSLRGIGSLSERSVLLAGLASGQSDAQQRAAVGGAATVSDGVAATGLLRGAVVVPTPTPTPAPAFTSQPKIVGTPTVGQPLSSLTFTDGTVSNGSVTSRAYLLAGAAKALSYVLVSGDVGASLTLQNTATGTDGSTITATSAGVAVVAAAVTLSALGLTSTAFTTGGATSVGITGKTSGSTIAATSSDGTSLTVSGTTLTGTFTAAGSPTITLTETLAGATNTPRSSAIGVTVTASNLPTTQPTFTPATTTAGFPAEPQAYAMGA